MPRMLLSTVCRGDSGKPLRKNPFGYSRRWLLAGCAVLTSFFFSFNASAAKSPADVRLVIDVSGSMKQNDPKNLRRPALELLVQVVPEKSKAGVWTFGQAVNLLVPHEAVTDQWRKGAIKQVNQIGSVALYTNIGEALEKAAYDFKKLDPKLRTSVILLTDGMVDISPDPQNDAAERERILKEIMPRYRDAGVAIHSIALSRHADSALMEQLSIGTNGITAVVDSADELMKVLLRVFDEAAPPEQVPLKDNTFLIDSSVDEFTALVFRKQGAAPTYLMGPDGKRIDEKSAGDDVRWHATAAYDLITVRHPFEGEWKLFADADPDTRVTVVSDLSLDVERLPKNLFLGNLPTLHAQLAQDGKIITDKAFLSIIDVSVEVKQTESGKRWRKSLSQSAPVPDDGIYSASLSMMKEAAPFEVAILVDGKTFQRSAKQLVTVREVPAPPMAEDEKAPEPEHKAAEPEHKPAVVKEPEPAPAAKKSTEEKPAEEGKEHEDDKSPDADASLPGWLLWTGLALGNLLVMGLGFVAFRMVRGKKQAGVLDDESDDNADISLESEAATSKDKTMDLLAELAGSDGSVQLDEPKRAKASDSGIIDIGDDNDGDDPFAELLGKPDEDK